MLSVNSNLMHILNPKGGAPSGEAAATSVGTDAEMLLLQQAQQQGGEASFADFLMKHQNIEQQQQLQQALQQSAIAGAKGSMPGEAVTEAQAQALSDLQLVQLQNRLEHSEVLADVANQSIDGMNSAPQFPMSQGELGKILNLEHSKVLADVANQSIDGMNSAPQFPMSQGELGKILNMPKADSLATVNDRALPDVQVGRVDLAKMPGLADAGKPQDLQQILQQQFSAQPQLDQVVTQQGAKAVLSQSGLPAQVAQHQGAQVFVAEGDEASVLNKINPRRGKLKLMAHNGKMNFENALESYGSMKPENGIIKNLATPHHKIPDMAMVNRAEVEMPTLNQLNMNWPSEQMFKESSAEGSVPSSVLDLSKINVKSTQDLINKISDYIIHSKLENTDQVQLNLFHKDLGHIGLMVEKTTQSNEVHIEIMTESKKGLNFFSDNRAQLLSQLKHSGIQVKDFVVDMSQVSRFAFESSSFDSRGSQTSQQQGQNFSSNQEQSGSSARQGQQQSHQQDSKRRQELWQMMSEREAA